VSVRIDPADLDAPGTPLLGSVALEDLEAGHLELTTMRVAAAAQ